MASWPWYPRSYTHGKKRNRSPKTDSAKSNRGQATGLCLGFNQSPHTVF